MFAQRADTATSSIIGTHYTPIEIEKLYPESDSMRWGKFGEAVLLDNQGRPIVAFEATENDEDGGMDFKLPLKLIPDEDN